MRLLQISSQGQAAYCDSFVQASRYNAMEKLVRLATHGTDPDVHKPDFDPILHVALYLIPETAPYLGSLTTQSLQIDPSPSAGTVAAVALVGQRAPG